MTNTSPKGQRVPAPTAEVVVVVAAAAAAARPPMRRAGTEPVPVLLRSRLPLPPSVPLTTGAGLQNYGPFPTLTS